MTRSSADLTALALDAVLPAIKIILGETLFALAVVLLGYWCCGY